MNISWRWRDLAQLSIFRFLHLGGLPFNVVVYINFLFKTFKDCSKSIWTYSKAKYHMVKTRWFPNSSFISSISMTILNSSILMCDKMPKDETCNYTHKHVVASFHWWSSSKQHIAKPTHDLVHAMAFPSRKQNVI
jgi:hypothetical protein